MGTDHSEESDFGYRVFKALRDTVPDDNFVFSPISVKILMEMIYLGSEGKTKKEIKKLVGIDEDKNAHEALMSAIKKRHKESDSDGASLISANKIFVQEGFEIKENYFESLKSLSATIESLQFNNALESANKINEWVSSSTNHKIKTLFSEDSIGSDTKLVLANVIYFKGEWLKKFKTSDTTSSIFYLKDKTELEVLMMKVKHKFYYRNLSNINAQAVCLPYSNSKLSMLIIVPREITGLKKIEKSLLDPSFFEFVHKMTDRNPIDLRLPKFRIKTSSKLTQTLQALGLKSMFSHHANFSALSDDSLYVSSVVQKCYIDINEEGTEAAAASGAEKNLKKMQPETIEMRVDRPFFFQIFKKDVVLFSGVCEKPIQN